MMTLGLSRETIRTFYTPGPADGWGLGPDVISAYCGVTWGSMNRGSGQTSLAFPGGNDGIGRHMVKTLIPRAISGPNTVAGVYRGRIDFSALDKPGQAVRIRLGSTVAGVKHEGEPRNSKAVSVMYTQDGKAYSVKARAVVMANGSWTTKHIVLDLDAARRDAYNQFHRSPCLIANVALRNWRFLYRMGISGGYWFEGMGVYGGIRTVPTFATEVKEVGPDSPVVLTLKVLFCRPGLPMEEQQTRGRAELFSTPFRDYERKIREPVDRYVRRFRFRRKARYRRHHSQSLGSCVRQSAAGVLFWQGRKAGLPRYPAQFARSAESHSPTRICRETRVT